MQYIKKILVVTTVFFLGFFQSGYTLNYQRWVEIRMKDSIQNSDRNTQDLLKSLEESYSFLLNEKHKEQLVRYRVQNRPEWDKEGSPEEILEEERSRYAKDLAVTQSQFEYIKSELGRVKQSPFYKKSIKNFVQWRTEDFKEEGYHPVRGKLEQLDWHHRYKFIDTAGYVNNVKSAEAIQREYGVRIISMDSDFILADITGIYVDFKSFPKFVIYNSELKNLYIAEPTSGAAAQVEYIPGLPGADMRGEFNSHGEDGGLIPHELTHALNKSQTTSVDSQGWANLNKDAKPYLFSSGSAYLRAKAKNPSLYERVKAVDGYARPYGYFGGFQEDVATVSETLFVKKMLEESLLRATTDPILKAKLEFMAGYRLDRFWKVERGGDLSLQQKSKRKETKDDITREQYRLLYTEPAFLNQTATDHRLRFLVECRMKVKLIPVYRFGTPISEADYKQRGFYGITYWRKWSRDSSGKVWFDPDFYHEILKGNTVRFEENNGTIELKVSTPPM